MRPESLKKTINIYFRKKTDDKHSIENLFDPLITALSDKNEFLIRKVEMPWSNEGSIHKIRNILFTLGQKADIHHISGDIHYIALALVFKKTIITVHDLNFTKDKNILKLPIFNVLWIYIPFLLAKKIIAISNETQKQIVSYYRGFAQKTTVIPNFVREEYMLSISNVSKKPSQTILHIGTKKNKNLERLIEASKDLPYNLIVVGPLTNLQKKLLHQNKINYQEQLNLSLQKMIDIYSTSGILHFTSLSEGFGLPILEAQSTGLPVITSNLSPMNEIAGEGAIYVNPYNTKDIKNAILRLFNDGVFRTKIVSEGYQNVKKYTLENAVQNYQSLYISL